MAARTADRGRHEVALREPVAVLGDDAEQLVAEDQVGLTGRRRPELAGRDLAVGAADADLERPDQQAVRPRLGVRDRRGAGRARLEGGGDQRLHGLTRYVRGDGARRHLAGAGLFRFDAGDARILIDPFFAEHEARLYPPPSVDEHGSDVDWLLVTHEHIDHLDPYSLREVAARSPKLKVIAPAPLAGMVRDAADVELVAVDRGDRLDLGGAGSLTVVPAVHGRTVADGYPDDPAFVGYVLELGGTTVYHAGDTIVTDSLRAALAPLRDRRRAAAGQRPHATTARPTTWSATWAPAMPSSSPPRSAPRCSCRSTGTSSAATPSAPGASSTTRSRPTRPLHVLTLRRGVPWAP